MEPRFLLDTNVLIYVRSKKPEKVERRVLSLIPGEAALSVITFGELLYGAAKAPKPDEAVRRLREFTEFLPVLELPTSAGEEYGAIRAELESKGEVIGGNDLWIAAHAKAAGLTLVTNNEREFRRVRGLKIQNWAR